MNTTTAPLLGLLCVVLQASDAGAHAPDFTADADADGPSPTAIAPTRTGFGAVRLAEDAPVEREGLRAPLRSRQRAGAVVFPENFQAAPDGSFDVLVHFHGGAQGVEPIVDASGLTAAVIIVNLGVGSGAYEQAYGDAQALDRTLAAVTQTAKQKLGLEHPKVGRLALSAWSAGYGAVAKILANDKTARRVDAVLLADGLHAGFVGRQLDGLKMAPFAAFADRAARGEVLFAVTHSSIPTYGYGSTTETARWLEKHVGAETRKVDEEAHGMHLVAAADRGDFHVRGFTGMTTDDHCDHLHGIGATLWSRLKTRWR